MDHPSVLKHARQYTLCAISQWQEQGSGVSTVEVHKGIALQQAKHARLDGEVYDLQMTNPDARFWAVLH
jgi:hypothetical protein